MTNDPLTRLALECRRIFLRDHVVPVRIGAHDFEKTQAQRVVFNVELFVPYATSTPQADKLAEVVDYDFVRAAIARRVAAGHVELQETLCDDLAAATACPPAGARSAPVELQTRCVPRLRGRGCGSISNEDAA